MKEFSEYMKSRKPVMGMLHLKGGAGDKVLERAKREIDIYLTCGVDALLVENYFGSDKDCEMVLRYLRDNLPESLYGVNILGNYRTAFRLCEEYEAKFMQIDSVCGHLPLSHDATFAEDLNELRARSGAAVLGGVRFKYQPVRSGRSVEEDLKHGMERCDAIVVTGEGTGIATPIEKVREFRKVVGDFPLVVGAGVTIDSIAESMPLCDGMIVGSWFKYDHSAYEDVCREFVGAFMDRVRGCRV